MFSLWASRHSCIRACMPSKQAYVIRRAVRGRFSTASNDNAQQNSSPSFRLLRQSAGNILHSRHERSAKTRGGSYDRDRFVWFELTTITTENGKYILEIKRDGTVQIGGARELKSAISTGENDIVKRRARIASVFVVRTKEEAFNESPVQRPPTNLIGWYTSWCWCGTF